MQTRTIDVNQDLTVEIHKADTEHAPVILRILSKSLAGSAVPGAILFWLEETEALQDAIEDAYCIGLGWERGIGTDNAA